MQDSYQQGAIFSRGKRKTSLANQIREKLSYLTHGIIHNNKAGRLTYTTLTIIEHIFICLVLLFTSYPTFAFNDLIDTRNIKIFKIPSSMTFSICYAYFAFIFLVFLFLLKILISTVSFDHALEQRTTMKLFAGWVALQRTVMTFIQMIVFVSCLQEVLRLKESQGEYATNSKIIILLISLSVSVYIMLLVVSISIVKLPLPNKEVPWACIQSKTIYFKEVIKGLLIAQETFLDSVRENHLAHSGYFVFLLLAFVFLVLERSIYFDRLVDKVQKYSMQLCFCFCIICSFRLFFISQILEITIFYPVIAFSVIKFLEFLEDRKFDKFLGKLEKIEAISSNQFIQGINQIMRIIERQNEKDLLLLQRIQHNHRISCFEENCICQKYYSLVIERFKKEDLFDINKKKNDQQVDFEDQEEDNTANRKRQKYTNNHNTIVADSMPGGSLFGQQFEEEKTNIYQNPIDVDNIKVNLHHEPITGSKPNPTSDMFSITDQQRTGMNGNNWVVSDLTIEDLFKDVLEMEQFQQKNNEFGNNQQNQHQENELIFKSQYEARKYFFIWLLEQIFKEMEISNQSISAITNIEFQMLYINFINQYLQRHFLAVFQLLRINKTKQHLGFFDRLVFSVCEQQILKEAIINFKNTSNGFDYSLYIEGNNQQSRVNELYEMATQDIIDFWKQWKAEDPNIKQVLEIGRQVTQTVRQIKILTKKLEDSMIARRDISRYQLYILFHLEMLNDPITSNQMQSYIKNQIMMRDKSKMFGLYEVNGEQGISNFQSYFSDQGICIVQAWGGERKQWEFLYGNKACCDIVGCTENKIIGQNINIIMPMGIAAFHNEFIKRFYQEGKPKVLGLLRILFIKNLQGFLVPIQFRLNFYYHQKFSYAFIATLEKVKFMNLYQEEHSRIPTDDCMVFLTDSDMNITEHSQNVLSFVNINMEQWKSMEELNGKSINMKSIVVDLDLIMQQEFGMSMIPSNDEQALVNKLIVYRKYNHQQSNFDDSQVVTGFLTYFQQCFSTKVDRVKVHTFIIVPMHKHPDYEGFNMNTTSSFSMSRGLLKNSHPFPKGSFNQQSLLMKSSLVVPAEKGGKEDVQSQGSLSKRSEIQQQEMFEKISSMSSSSGSDNGVYQANYAKNLLFTNKSPKILRTSVFIIVGMLLSFFVVSVYNLIIFLVKHQEISDRILAYYYITERNIHIRACINDLKMLHSITHKPQQLNRSNIFPPEYSRIGYYQQNLKDNLLRVQEFSLLFDSFLLSHTSYSGLFLNFDDLKFLTEEGYVYTQSVSFKHSVQLFQTYADSIDVNTLLKQKPVLNTTGYAYYGTTNNTLSILQRQLFFLFENGLYTMEELGQRQVNMVKKASAIQTTESKQVLNVTTFVSIAIVTFIMIVIYPILIKIIDRQYLVIRFFTFMKSETVDLSLTKGYRYQRSLMLKNEDNNIKEYDEKPNLTNDDTSLKDQNSSLKGSDNKDRKQSIENIYRTSQPLKITTSGDLKNKMGKNTNRFSSKIFEENKQRNLRQKRKKIKDKIQNQDFLQEESKIEEDIDESKSEQDNDPEEIQKQQYNAKKSDELNMHRNHSINSQIRRLGITQKVKVFAIIFIGIIYLNASLLISFYYSQVVFDNDSQSTQSIGKYVQREECEYNLMLLMREKLLKNWAVQIRIFSTDVDYTQERAVYYYVDHCFEIESDIASIRKSYPDYLKEAKSILEDLESKQLCNITFEDDDLTKAYGCQNTLDKLLYQGIGNVMQYIITYIQQINLKFDSNSTKTLDFNFSILESTKMHDILDVISYYLKYSFLLQQQTIHHSTLSYFNSAKINYLLVFGIFISFTLLLALIFGVVIFKKIKQRILAQLA